MKPSVLRKNGLFFGFVNGPSGLDDTAWPIAYSLFSVPAAA